MPLPERTTTAVRRLRELAGDALVAVDDACIDALLDEIGRLADELAGASETVAAGVADASADACVLEPIRVVDPSDVGVPPQVQLVAPRDLKRRTWGSPAGRFATLHALAHIEANAVNLALDAVHRFDGMPVQYYVDWARVAIEERAHFGLLCARMADESAGYGGRYGDLGCHNGLWEIAEKTAHDVGARMALVPMVFEARGLDVTPGLIERFERHADPASAEVLAVVLRDEIGHVEVGRRWFGWLCAQRGVDPIAEFERLVAEASLLLVPPFNVGARVEAGFDPADLDRWAAAFMSGRS